MHDLKIFELEKTADAGDAEAQYALAELCLSPDSKLVQNFRAGVYWLEKAAGNKNANALFRLGQLYASGTYVLKEAKKAEEYYLAAAAHHHPEALRWFEEKEKMIADIDRQRANTDNTSLEGSTLKVLPRDMFLAIVSFLELADIMKVSTVCKFLRHIAFDSSTLLGSQFDERCEKYAKTRLAYEKFSLWNASKESVKQNSATTPPIENPSNSFHC